MPCSMNRVLFIMVELGSLSTYRLGNLLFVAGGFLLLKLDLMVLLIVSKHVLWPKVTPKSSGWIMVILFLQWWRWLLFIYLLSWRLFKSGLFINWTLETHSSMLFCNKRFIWSNLLGFCSEGIFCIDMSSQIFIWPKTVSKGLVWKI